MAENQPLKELLMTKIFEEVVFQRQGDHDCVSPVFAKNRSRLLTMSSEAAAAQNVFLARP